MSLGSGHPVPATPPDRIESDPISRRPTETLKASNPRCEAVLRRPAPRVAVRLTSKRAGPGSSPGPPIAARGSTAPFARGLCPMAASLGPRGVWAWV